MYRRPATPRTGGKALPAVLPVLAACLSLVGGPTALAQEKLDDFAFRQAIIAPPGTPYYRLSVPLAAYLASSHGDLGDLRVFDASGATQPHALLAASGSAEERLERRRLRWFPLRMAADGRGGDDSQLKVVIKQAADGTLVAIDRRAASVAAAPAGQAGPPVRGYLLDGGPMSQGPAAGALELDWREPSTEFQAVDVEASDDLKRWRPLVGAAQLARLDYQGARIENRRIELPAFGERYLRLIWRQPAQAPTLSGVELTLSHARRHGPSLVWSAPLAALADGDLEAGEYRLRLDRPLPLARLRIELPPGNQLLPLEILAPGRERRHWRLLARTVAYRIASKDGEWRQDEIPLAGQPVQELVLRLDRRRGGSLPAPRLAVALQPAELLFLAGGTPPYLLAVGNRQATSAALAPATLVPGFGGARSPEIAAAELAQPAVATLPAAPAAALAPATPRDWRRLALWAVLGLGVLAMAAMAWQLLRQLKQPDGGS